MLDALVIAGCLSGEKNGAGVTALVDELTAAVGADVVVRARTGGRPVGALLPDVLSDLRRSGARRVLVATTHIADGRLQRAAADAVRAATPSFDELRLAPPLLADEKDHAAVAAALDEALPPEPGRVVALAGHRGPECAAAFAQLEAALRARGRSDVLVAAPDLLRSRLRERAERAVLLVPLLMAFGHHARHDVLEGYAARLAADGLAVTPWAHSLAELPAVRALAIKHAMIQRDCPFVSFSRKELT